MDEARIKRVLRETTITIAITVAAMAMGALSIYLSYSRNGEFSFVGAIVVVMMGVNLFLTVKKRNAAKAELMKRL